MRPSLLWLLALAVACSSPAQQPATPAKSELPQPPPTRTSDQVDDYHGHKVADPYRWLEQDSAETQAWVQAQNLATRALLDRVPQRPVLARHLAQIWDFPKETAPTLRGGRAFWRHNDGLQNQAVLCWAPQDERTCKVLYDPNRAAGDGTLFLQTISPSDDGKLLGYALASGGSDWNEIHVREVDSGADRPDVLQWVKFSSIAWHPDGSGFWYSRYDAPKAGETLTGVNKFQKVCFHKLGTPQSADAVVHENAAQAEWGFGVEVSDDGHWWLLTTSRGAESKNGLDVREITTKGLGPNRQLASGFGGAFEVAGVASNQLFLRSDWGAPRGRLLALDLHKAANLDSDKPVGPLPAGWRQVQGEADSTLSFAVLAGKGIVLGKLVDASHQLEFVDYQGKPLPAPTFPRLGSVVGLSGHAGDANLFFAYVDFLAPARVYHANLDKGELQVRFDAKRGLPAEKYSTQLRYATSKDGTRVPIFVTARSDLPRDGSAPAYLYGYGGFSVEMTPFYKPDLQAWIEAGGVLAVAVLRGGAEFGEAWHQAGQLGKKQNVFDDFIASAELLTREKWTTSAHLAIAGGSNGGLLVGACLAQRPELFGAALPAVGVMDMLRYHLFTIGWGWVPEYGSSADAKAFEWLYKYSPLHNLHKGTAYPATLVTTGDHDDRVVPAHSFKFTAALQAAQGGPAPIRVRIETRAGHGAGKPTTKQIDEATDRLIFLVQQFGLQLPEAWK